MPNRMHAPPDAPAHARRVAADGAAGRRARPRSAAGVRRVRACSRPSAACACPRARNPAAADLVRHAFADVPGNSSLARSWAKCARSWPRGAQSQLLELYPRLDMPVLLLWADRDRLHPLAPPKRRSRCCPDGQLRVLESMGFLMAYDDPVGLARELAGVLRVGSELATRAQRPQSKRRVDAETSSCGAGRPPRPSRTSRSPARPCPSR